MTDHVVPPWRGLLCSQCLPWLNNGDGNEEEEDGTRRGEGEVEERGGGGMCYYTSIKLLH